MSKKHPRCKLCLQDARFSPSMSNAEIARSFGVSKDSARRHRKHVETDSFFGVPTEHITSRGITRRLDDGSYEKISWKPNTQETLEVKSTLFEDLKPVLDAPRPDPIKFVKGRGRVINLADFQIAKGDYGMDHTHTIERIRQSVVNLVEVIKEERPEELIVSELGDIIEGFFNTVSQRETNTLDLTTQIRVARRIIAEILSQLAPLCKRLVYVSVPSNHACVRTGVGAGAQAATSHNDWGLEISYQIEEIFADRPEFAHLTYLRPPVGEESVVYHSAAMNTTFGFVHGHQKKAPHMLGEWFKGQSHGKRNGMQNVDILFCGHFHSLNMYQSGGRWVIVCPTSDNGSSWFTNTTGEHGVTGILSCTARDGMWQNLHIY